jgi:uncharacterized membrane protein YgdD (TMEM256/DUF423 family)
MNKWQRISLVFAGISGAMAVLMGAAAAHWLQNSMDAAGLARIEKAATYQMYHSLALLVLPLLMQHWVHRGFRLAAGLFMTGIICFSGSLYAYSFSGLHALVFVTPIGGVSWIVAWLCLAYAGYCCSAPKKSGQ